MSRFALIVVMAMSSVSSFADDKIEHPGLKHGEAIGLFYVTKIAGAEDDGVMPGDDLCYRCRYGSSPMVMVFARDTGGKVPELIKQLDSAVAANTDARLKGLLTLMGEDTAVLKDDAKKVASQSGAKRVPVVIAKDTQSGPTNYKLPADVEVTIVVAKDSKVVSTHNYDAEAIDLVKVMSDVKKMLH